MTISEKSLKLLLNQINNTLKLNLTASRRLKIPSNWKVTEHGNLSQHILFVKAGFGKYIFRTHEILLEPGSLIFVSSNCPHYAVHDKDNPLVIHNLRFSFCNGKSMDQLPMLPFSIGVKVDDFNTIETIMVKIDQLLYPGNTAMEQLSCNTLTTFILSEILNQTQFKGDLHTKQSKVDIVRRHMMKNICTPRTIEYFADTVNLSPRHLRSCFKERYGLSPKQYQLKLKMDYAKFLLETTSMTVKSVSATIGYSDPFVFSRQFKDFFGVSPSKIN